MPLPTLTGVQEAAGLLQPFMAPTPLVHSELLSRNLEAEVWIKNETVSPIASFKLRGALTALLRAGRETQVTGVVTSSTGNHGQGVAYAARLLNLSADVFLPEAANPAKEAMIEAFGARIHHLGHDLDAAKQSALAFARKRGLLFVDDGESLDLMEGAGTVGLEIAETLEPHVVLIPMGSGTLAGGSAAALKARHPGCRVIAVQAKGSPAMVESFHARRAVELPADSVADGLMCRIPAQLALEVLWAHLDDAVAVPDEDLLQGVRLFAEEAHLLTEPAGAAALAGAWLRRDAILGRRIVLVATGSNITPELLRRALPSA